MDWEILKPSNKKPRLGEGGEGGGEREGERERGRGEGGRGREGERERERILLNFYEVTITTSPKTGKDSTTKQNK